MADTFIPPVNPSYTGPELATKPRIRRQQLGDGYSQRSGDGLNRSLATLTLKWDPISVANADVIQRFCWAHDAGQAFLYTAPRSSFAQIWSLVSWSRQYPYANDDAFVLELQQEADIL